MNNHTPGKWEYSENKDAFAIYDEHGVIIAMVFKNGSSNPEAIARLIAYAPDTRNALEWLNEGMKATEAFLAEKGYDSESARDITVKVEGLIKLIDGKEND